MFVAAARILNVPPAGGDTVIGDADPTTPVESPVLSFTAVIV
jgi:hypothetical protein